MPTPRLALGLGSLSKGAKKHKGDERRHGDRRECKKMKENGRGEMRETEKGEGGQGGRKGS